MSFPRYEEYKDSGVEWLGEVPRQWGVRRLKFLADIQTGGKDTVDAEEDGKYPFFVRSQTVEKINTSTYDCEAILTAGDGVGVGKVFHHYIGPFDFHQRVYMMNEFRNINGRFLFHYIRANFYKVALEGGAKSTVDSIRRPMIADFPVVLPPPDEQTAIASFLDAETSKIDGLVGEQRRLIELLKEKRQAVISHAVTKGLNPNAPIKPSGSQWLGDVPEHWSVQRVKHAIGTIEQGWSPQCEISPVENGNQWGVLKVGCVNYGRFSEQENKALPPDLKPKPELAIKKGDLLISRANTIELVGSAAVAGHDYANLMLCDKLYRLRVDSTRLLPEFLCFFLTCELAREPIELGATGASPSMKNIAQSVITELWFAAPEVKEQREIIESINEQSTKLDDLIEEAERAIGLFQERRTALISAAVTGKIDVREIAN